MSTTYANSWDAGRLLNEMGPEARDRLRSSLADHKLLYAVLDRPYNKRLLSYVERKLKEETR